MGAPQRVVVGFDGSSEASAALAYAAGRVGAGGLIVAVYADEPVVVASTMTDPGIVAPVPSVDPTVVPPPSNPNEHPVFAALPAGRVEGVPCERVVVSDWPARALIDVARERDADEIIIGARRHGRIHDALSSVFRELVHDADRPVVIIPPGMHSGSS